MGRPGRHGLQFGRTLEKVITRAALIAAVLLMVSGIAAAAPLKPTPQKRKMALAPPGAPIVIARRGGFIEPDLVSTKDHQLVTRHEAAPTGMREHRFAR